MKDKEVLKRLISNCSGSSCASCSNKKECDKFFIKAGIDRKTSDPKRYIAFAEKLYELSEHKVTTNKIIQERKYI